MPNKVVPTFFKKTVSLSTSASVSDELSESIFLSVNPVIAKSYISPKVTLSVVVGQEDSGSTTKPSYQYWTD